MTTPKRVASLKTAGDARKLDLSHGGAFGASGLARLVGSTGVGSITGEERVRPFVVRAPCTMGFAQDEVDEALRSETLTYPTLRLMAEGEAVPPNVYLTRDGSVDIGSVWRHFSRGASIVLSRLDYRLPWLARLCKEISAETDGPTWVNAYLSPPGRGALGKHRDDHNVLVAQVSGEKVWRIDVDSEGIMYGRGRGNGEDDRKVKLAQGDVLFLPMGTGHSTCAERQVSVHLTFGFRSRDWIEALEDAVASLGSEWRRPRMDVKHARFHATLTQLLSDLQEALLNPAKSRGDGSTRGGLNEEIVVAGVGLRSVLRARAESRFVWRVDADHLVMDGAGQHIRMSAVVEPFLARLLTGGAVRVVELAALLESTAWRELVGVLLRAGIAELEEGGEP